MFLARNGFDNLFQHVAFAVVITDIALQQAVVHVRAGDIDAIRVDFPAMVRMESLFADAVVAGHAADICLRAVQLRLLGEKLAALGDRLGNLPGVFLPACDVISYRIRIVHLKGRETDAQGDGRRDFQQADGCLFGRFIDDGQLLQVKLAVDFRPVLQFRVTVQIHVQTLSVQCEKPSLRVEISAVNRVVL